MLVERLKDRDASVGRAALRALLAKGEEAAEVMPALVEHFDGQPGRAPLLAALALAAIGQRAIPGLLEIVQRGYSKGLFDSQTEESAAFAVEALAEIGPPAIEPLLALMEADNWRLRGAVATALGAMGAAARQSTPALLAVLAQQTGDMRSSSIQDTAMLATVRALSLVAPLDPPTVRALILARRFAGTAARRELGGHPTEAVPSLVSLLKDPDKKVRREAAEVLGDLGLRARSAVPALNEALSDSDKGVANKAREALTKVRGQ